MYAKYGRYIRCTLLDINKYIICYKAYINRNRKRYIEAKKKQTLSGLPCMKKKTIKRKPIFISITLQVNFLFMNLY